MSSWLEKLIPGMGGRAAASDSKTSVPEGLWKKCPRCGSVLYRPELDRNLNVCPKCTHHLRMGARERIDSFLDAGEREELGSALEPTDKLKFKDTRKYRERIQLAQKETGEKDALVVMKGRVGGVPAVVAAFEFRFLGGSMGAVVGERFLLGVNACIEEQRALICFSASGGARMQEALISLLQMAKTAAALERLRQKSLPYISVMTDPVFGGVSASLAMLGDLNIAEPNALIGFAGPRVIEQTVRETLPEGFQRSEFLLEHGALDMILTRHALRERIPALLAKFMHLALPQILETAGYDDATARAAVAASDAPPGATTAPASGKASAASQAAGPSASNQAALRSQPSADKGGKGGKDGKDGKNGDKNEASTRKRGASGSP